MVTGIIEIDIFLFFVGLLAWIIDRVFFDGKLFASPDEESSEDQEERPPKVRKKDGPSERQRKQLAKCAMEHCNSLSFRNSEYCWKHKDGEEHETDGPGWWEEGGTSV